MKPLYRVKIGKGYYSADERWQEVPKERATKLTHKDALRVASHLRQPRIGTPASIEPVEGQSQ